MYTQRSRRGAAGLCSIVSGSCVTIHHEVNLFSTTTTNPPLSFFPFLKYISLPTQKIQWIPWRKRGTNPSRNCRMMSFRLQSRVSFGVKQGKHRRKKKKMMFLNVYNHSKLFSLYSSFRVCFDLSSFLRPKLGRLHEASCIVSLFLY